MSSSQFLQANYPSGFGSHRKAVPLAYVNARASLLRKCLLGAARANSSERGVNGLN